MSDLYQVYVSGEESQGLDEAAVCDAVAGALRAGGRADPCALTINLTIDEEVRRLNQAYAGLDTATDVLSFAADDEPYAVDPDEPPYLGDVVIAVGVAAAQAADAGHSLLDEVRILAVHGTLHLLGYDHADADQQAQMQAVELAALTPLGLGAKL